MVTTADKTASVPIAAKQATQISITFPENKSNQNCCKILAIAISITTPLSIPKDTPRSRHKAHSVKAIPWTIIKELCEKGVSGFKVAAEDRDAIQELRNDAMNKRFDILLVFMFDRLGRRDDETPFVVEWFAQQGIRIFSVKEGEQKFESHTDSLINYIRYWQSEGESRKTSMRIKARERRELENKALDLERRLKNEKEMSEKVAEYYNRFLGWSMEFGLATIERKRIIISQLYKRIELGRGYVVNFEVDWNYEQFIDALQMEKHKGMTEVGIPMPPKVKKRVTKNINRKSDGAA